MFVCIRRRGDAWRSASLSMQSEHLAENYPQARKADRRASSSRRKASLSRGEIMIDRLCPYSIRNLSSESAGLESGFRVGVTVRISSSAICHRNGPLCACSSDEVSV